MTTIVLKRENCRNTVNTHMQSRYPVRFDFRTQRKNDFQTEWVHDKDFGIITVAEKSNIITVGHVICLKQHTAQLVNNRTAVFVLTRT